MSDQQTIQLTMRASDGDRQQVVERLQGALEEGRLSMDEFTDRTGLAFRAVTYGDLAPLCEDLPASSPVIAPGRRRLRLPPRHRRFALAQAT